MGNTDWIKVAFFGNEGKTFFTRSADGTVCMGDRLTGKVIKELKNHIKGIYSLTLSPSGDVMVIGSYAETSMWKLFSDSGQSLTQKESILDLAHKKDIHKLMIRKDV